MMNIALPDELAKRLEEIAQRENRPVENVVASMIEQYASLTTSQKSSDTAFEALFGIYDDDITDISSTVRETLQKYYQEKYGSSD